MSEPNFILLYVNQPSLSAHFYRELLASEPVEESEHFALFVLSSGLKLGLWAKHTVEPAAQWQGASGELCFAVADRAQVAAQYAAWQAKGLAMAQPITEMDFGLTFVALDPDGHRLRVFAAA